MRSKKNSWGEIPVPYINHRRKRNSGLKNLIHEPTWRFFNDPHLFSLSGSNFSSLSEKKKHNNGNNRLETHILHCQKFYFLVWGRYFKKVFSLNEKKKMWHVVYGSPRRRVTRILEDRQIRSLRLPFCSLKENLVTEFWQRRRSKYYEPSYELCTYMYLVEVVPETPRVDGMHDVIKLNEFTPDFWKSSFRVKIFAQDPFYF